MMRASVFRLSPFLLLAAALVALGAFFAHSPQPAEAQSSDPYTYWSATLTVKEDTGEYGCSDGAGGSFVCGSTTLTNKGFSYGNDYTVTDIVLNSAAALNFVTSPALPSHGAEEFTLLVDGVPFPLADATAEQRTLYWTNSGLSWSVGDEVRLMLVRRNDPACLSNPSNLNRSLNPRNLTVFPGDGLLTLAWDLPPSGKRYGWDMVRWRKAGTDLWLNSNGAAGNETRRGFNVTHEITGLDNDQRYQVEVRQIAFNAYEELYHATGVACLRSGWVSRTATTLPMGPTDAPTEMTVTASGPLREGGPPVKVYFTLDQPAPRRMPATLGHAGHGWFNSEGPTFSKGATTAVMPIRVVNDSDDNNCRTLYFDVWFPGEYGGVEFQDEVAFTVVDDDGASDSCSGRLGSPNPTRLTLERIRIDAPQGQQYVSVHVQPKLNRPALGLRIVDVTLDVDRSTATRGRFGHSGVDFAISGAHYEGTTDYGDSSVEAHTRDSDGNGRLYVHPGKTKPTYTDERGEHDFTTEIIIDRNASANETIVLTATSGDLVATPLTLRVGSMVQQAISCTNCGALGEPGVVTFASASHADLIEDIYEWRNDPRYVHDKRHTDRWDRVLLAFGETVSDSSLTAMGSSEAQGYTDRGWSRWVGVAEALRDLESSGQPQDPEPDIPNRAPVASTVGDVTIVNESGTRRFTSNSMFEDPDKDDMTVTGTSSDTSVATVSASTDANDGSILTVSAKSRGTATITATADDGNGGTATNSFTVRVKAAPTVASAISDVTGLTAGDSQLVSLSGVFSDADGDALSITAGALDEDVAVAEISSDGASLTVTGVSAGETGIGVFAHDSDGNQVTANFTVTVTASEPVALVPPQDQQQPQQQPEQPEPEPSPTPELETPAQEPETEAETPGPEAADAVVSRYDTNGDGKIDRAEMGNAINDYIAGKITYPQVVEVNKAFQPS